MTTQTLVEIGTAGGSSIIGPLITAVATIIAATTVGVFSWRQWRIAKDKLALDLFDRRMAASTAFTDAAVARMEEIADTRSYNYADHLENPQPIVKQLELTKRTTDIHFLFGPEVTARATRILINLTKQSQLHEEMMKEKELLTPGFEAYWAERMRLTNLSSDFRKSLEPYMMLGDIAVNRPAKRWKLEWPFKRPKV